VIDIILLDLLSLF